MAEDKPEKSNKEENEIQGNSLSYRQLSTLGLDYLQRQRHFLLLSLIFPIFWFVLQILNTFFILDVPNHPPEQRPPDLGSLRVVHVPVIDMITPGIIFTVLAIVAIVKIAFLFNIRIKVDDYSKRLNDENNLIGIADSDESKEEFSIRAKKVSLTDLFYDLADHLNTIQKLSILFYIICFFFFQWYIRYFLLLFGGFPLGNPTFNNVLYYINLVTLVVLILYLIPDFRQFIHWQRKLRKLHEYEQKIYREFEG